MCKNNEVNVFTIGFTKKPAEEFFSLIKNETITKVLDVRLNTGSQLSGFAKQRDLKFFLEKLCETEYIHLPDWAPTKEILTAYKKKDISWESYEDKFLNLIAKRNIERDVTKELLKDGCLLCSEHKPHHCHRRLVIEYFNENTSLELKVKHLF